jgi:hypothetical protein
VAAGAGQLSEWHPSHRTALNIQRSQARLTEQFQHYLDLFDRSSLEGKTFGGPSLYFHFRCIAPYVGWPVRRKLADERFTEYLYAVLASWGMHRMGDTAAKLRPFKEFKANILAQAARLSELEQYTILTLSESDLDTVLALSHDVLGELLVSKSGAQLVAASKVLHHIIPDLLPPIDRRYTLAFFGINAIAPSQYSAQSMFRHLYPPFVAVARERSELIRAKVSLEEENWHTSYTKVIDNAIVGSFEEDEQGPSGD